jgi:ribosomal protein S18 acetylase RimI-like enzyme
MAQAPTLTVRPATLEDLPQLVDIYVSAFESSALDSRVWPANDPESAISQRKSIGKNLDEITVAETESAAILGWARWVRKDEDMASQPRHIVTPDDFPPTGDQDLGVRFFQNNVDKSRAMHAGRAHWFLSILVVHPTAQKKGVGTALMKEGLSRADKDGWFCCLNASAAGVPLYERFGFKVVDDTYFQPGIHAFHMKREAAPSL